MKQKITKNETQKNEDKHMTKNEKGKTQKPMN